MIHPTIGRRVWFRPDSAIIAVLAMTVHDVNAPLDAGIVYVWNDRMVNLDVTDHAGKHHAITSVKLVQEGEDCPPSHYAMWMPYQQKQNANAVGSAEAVIKPTTAPSVSDLAIEQEIQAKGKTAPRITLDDIEANIAFEHYFTANDGVEGAMNNGTHHVVNNQGDITPSLRLLTFCVIILRNGFTVTGESACASPENFDAEIGRKIARQNAVQKIWPLMGYALKQHLHDRADIGNFGERTIQPTHRCKECGALWTLHAAGVVTNEPTWQLHSKRAGQCCDNALMGDQIEAI